MASLSVTESLRALAAGPKVYANLSVPQLVETALLRGEARLAANGALVAVTGKRTGRSPKDKFTVDDAVTHEVVDWGKVNKPFAPERFEALLERVVEHLGARELFAQDLYCGADPEYRLPIRVISEYAWQALFVRQLFVRPEAAAMATHEPEFLVIAAPEFEAVPERDGTNSSAFILADFTRKIILIGGTKYAGEMKKSVFGAMNFIVPNRDVLPMHCSANVGADGVSALFFGFSFLSKNVKILYFAAIVIPLAFVLITIQRGELKRVRLHLVRLGYALAGILIVFVPWYFLIYLRYPEVFQSIATINTGAAAPGVIGGLVKNWLFRPPFTFFPANRALAVPLFLYFLGLLGTLTARRWKAQCSPLEIVAALWFVVGVGINSLIGYRPVRHYIDLTIPLLILVSLFLGRFLRGFAWSFPKNRSAGLFAGLFALIWVAVSFMRSGLPAWGWIDRDPIAVLKLSFVLALGLAVILGLALRYSSDKPWTVPRAWAAPLVVALIGIYAYQNVAEYVSWRRTLSYQLQTIGRDLGRAFPEGVFSGLLAPSLSLENRNPAHTMYPHYANDDPGFLERARVTHLILGTYNNERQYYDKLFPDVMRRARHLITYRMWRSWWTLFDVGRDLPPEDPAVHEAETMERSAGAPLFDPPAGGRFAVLVESPDWETIGRDRIALPVPGLIRGQLFVRAAGSGPLDMRLYVRMSLRGRIVFKNAFVLRESTGAPDYVGLPFKFRTEGPGNYLLEVKAAGSGSFFFDRMEFRPESKDSGSRTGDSR